MASLLPVNASSPARAEWIARDGFARMAPDGIVLDDLTLDHVEPVRPFDRVALAESGTAPVACYVYSVTYHRENGGK